MARRHRSYSLEFKRHVAQQYLSGDISLARLARQHDISRNLIRVWIAKYEAGEFDDEQVQGDLLAGASIAHATGRVAFADSAALCVGASVTPTLRIVPPLSPLLSVFTRPVPMSGRIRPTALPGQLLDRSPEAQRRPHRPTAPSPEGLWMCVIRQG